MFKEKIRQKALINACPKLPFIESRINFGKMNSPFSRVFG